METDRSQRFSHKRRRSSYLSPYLFSLRLYEYRHHNEGDVSILGQSDVEGGRKQLDALRAALAGRYEILFRIGGGGAADVYAARDWRDAREVAVKVFSGRGAQEIGVERFVREIQVTTSLEHPGILPVIESGTDGGFLYYVMPFAHEGTLADLMVREGRLPVRRVCTILRDLTGALLYAHDRGIVHRDIKPDNVMLFGDRAILADFGIAKLLRGGVQLSSGGIPLGTPDFMAPEQILSRPVDRRTDIYALGVLAYEMLTGEPLFYGDNAMQIMAAHAKKDPPDLRSRRPGLPVGLTEAVRKCLQKAPIDRWQDMADFGSAIAAVEVRLARPSSDAWFLPIVEPRPSFG